MTFLTSDTFFNGRIKIKQNRCGYRFSIDAVILAAHVLLQTDDTIVDLGTGCGVIPLILAFQNPEVRICGIEVQEGLAALAVQNVQDNAMGPRIRILCRDMKTLTLGMVSGPVSLVISNPPYRKLNSGRLNPNQQRAVARHEVEVVLLDVIETARRILSTSGRFVTIYPAGRITDLLSQMRSSGIEPNNLRMVHSNRFAAAKLILVEGVKAGRPGVKIDPPLFIYRENGAYTKEVQKMFRP